MQGQVIGMNIAILSGTDTFSGIGFVVPSNAITKIVVSLIQKGSIYILIWDLVAIVTWDLAEALQV